MTIATVNPATGEVVKRFDPLNDEELENKVALADRAFRQWRRTTFSERAALMQRAADILDERKEHWGYLMTLEMGKPIKAAVAEAEKCAWVCRFYADNARRFLADEPVATDAGQSYIRYEPMGPVLAVMPWNFPFWQVWRFAAPAAMAGNTGLLKHASNVPQCALAIEEIFCEAGFPAGVFQALLIGSGPVKRLLEDPRIKAVTLTGSEPAGASVAETAGRQIKKAVLELGGSDPFIVMPSADLEKAIATAVQARCINNGQSCIAAKRFIVHESIARHFEQGFVARMAALQVGDPMDPRTDIGPMATPSIVEELSQQVQQTVAAGGHLLLGGEAMEGAGNFFQPTVLTDIPWDSPAYRDELFGPVASIFRVASLDQAIELANDSIFGLGASAWTNDPAERQQLIGEIESGNVFINGMVKSDPRLPFGGVKHSGYGRELSAQGIREFVNIKTVWIA
jgi:succinate-semialdehyde dehydrogenase/glutarate-semialdehyde dehydrogenase